MLAIDPGLVRFELAEAGPDASIDELRAKGVRAVSPTGVLGDPRRRIGRRRRTVHHDVRRRPRPRDREVATDRPDAAPVRVAPPVGAADGARALRRRRVVAALRPGASSPAHRCGSSGSPTAGAGVADSARTRRSRSTPSRLVDRLLDGGRDPSVDRRCRQRRATRRGSRCARRHRRDAAARRHGWRVTTGGSSSTTARQPPLVGAALRLPVNRGPAAARNAGRALVDTATDRLRRRRCRPARPSWLDALLPHFDDDAVGLVAPRVTGRARAHRSTSGAAPGAHPRRHAGQLRPRRGTRRARRGLRRDRRIRRADALRRGRRPRLAARRGRVAVPIRAGVDRSRTGRGRHWSRRMRQHAGYGTSAAPLALRHPEALAPGRVERMDGVGVGARARSGIPSPPARSPSGRRPRSFASSRTSRRSASFGLAMRGHAGAAEQIGARAAARMVAAPRDRCARCRGGPAGSPLPALLRSTSARLPTDAAYGWGVWSGHAYGIARSRRSSRASPRGRRVPLASTVVRREADDPHRAAGGATWRGWRPRSTVSCRSSRATATGSGERWLAETAAEFADTIAVGTIHELDGLPAIGHPGRAHADPRAAAPPRGRRDAADPHRRQRRPRRRARGMGRAVSLVKLGIVDAALRAAARSPSPRRHALDAAGLDVVGVSIHPPLAGTAADHAAEIATLDRRPSTRRCRCGSATSTPPAYASLPATHTYRLPPRHAAVARRQVDAAPHAPTCSTSAPVRAGRAGGLPPRRGRPADGHLVMIGAGSGPRCHRRSRRRPEPVPLRSDTDSTCTSRPTCTRRCASSRPGSRCRRSAIGSTCNGR